MEVGPAAKVREVGQMPCPGLDSFGVRLRQEGSESCLSGRREMMADPRNP